MKEKPTLYWDSDPFDWKDGEMDFTDIYILTRNNGAGGLYVSTAVPKGSEEAIERFIKVVAQEYKVYTQRQMSSEYKGNYKFPVQLRFSIARHNIQRVEHMLLRIAENVLPSQGYQPEEIEDFFNSVFDYNDMTQNKPHQLGALIKRKDPIGEQQSPACADGVVLSPKGAEAILMVSPSIYDPSGQRNIPLLPGQTLEYIPKKVNIRDCHNVTSDLVRSRMNDPHLSLLPYAEVGNNDHFYYRIPEGPVSNILFRLSRQTLKITLTMKDLVDLGRKDVVKGTESSDIARYRDRIMNNVALFIERHLNLVERLRNFLEPGKILSPKEEIIGLADTSDEFSIPEEFRDQIDYYLTLAETHGRLLKFIYDEYKSTRNIQQVITAARRLIDIKREDVANLPSIFEQLQEFGHGNNVSLQAHIIQ